MVWPLANCSVRKSDTPGAQEQFGYALSNLKNHFAEVLSFGRANDKHPAAFSMGKTLPNHRTQVSLRSPRRKLFPGFVHQLAICRKISQPQSVHTRAFGVEQAGVEQ